LTLSKRKGFLLPGNELHIFKTNTIKGFISFCRGLAYLLNNIPHIKTNDVTLYFIWRWDWQFNVFFQAIQLFAKK